MTRPAPSNDVSVFDRLKRPVWLFDPTHLRGLYANPPALALWGARSRDELLSRDFSQLSEAVKTRVHRLAQTTAGGETVSERWTFYPNGAPMTVQAVISAYPLSDGSNALLFEAAPVDVEEGERRAVEALRHTSSLITLFDAEGQPIFSNPAAYAAYGDDGVGFIERFSDQDHGRQVMTAVLEGQVLAELAQVRTSNGERAHHLDARSVLDPVTGQKSVLLSERDVTAQVEAERALAAASERVEVAVAKQRFLANMSHELRTPLNSIIGFSGLLAQRGLDSTAHEHVSRINEAGTNLLAIINDVIALSELDGGEARLDERAFDIGELMGKALKGVEAKAGEKGLILSLEAPEDMPELIGDAARLRAVMGHFLDNAVKFTDRGAVILGLGAAPEGPDKALIEISVEDTGPGIEPAVRDRLFARFTPGDDSAVKKSGGAGLGLAIARETMALMGGEVGVESEPGAGSRFWFRLVLPIDAAAAPEVETAAQGAEGPFKVLYADDHENNRALVQAVLATMGHACDVAFDGAQAVEMAGAGAYDLILMDIQMPVMDGVAAARAIRAASDIPILAVTANTLTEQMQNYLAAGMDDVVAKPVNMTELLAKTAQWGAAGAVRGERKAA